MGKWTRRGFIAAGIATGGVLAVGVGIREGHRAPKLAAMMEGEGETLVNVWVKLAQDNTVTAIIPHSEMGQGVWTPLAQMLAEEMDADWDKVSIEQAPAHEAYANYPLGKAFLLGDIRVPGMVADSLNGGLLRLAQSMSLQITGGSTAVRFTGRAGMQIAGAAARDMLIRAAAKEWGVPRGDIRAEKSHLYHEASGRSAPFSAFAEAAADFSPPRQPKLKSARDWSVIGTSKPRFDIPAKVDGSAVFAIDVDRPGMRYAAVRAAPVIDAKVATVNDDAARAMPGIQKIMREDDYVAVVADSYWRAQQGVDALQVNWTETGKESLSQAAIYQGFADDMARAVAKGDEKTVKRRGDARGAARDAARSIEADYRVPYLAHAAMEPLNAVAEVKEGKIDIWIGHQNPLLVRDEIARAFDVAKHDVTVHNCLLGGGFGRKSETDYPLMAVQIAKKAGVPVKMIWSREQDTQRDFYRPATTARVIGGLDENGAPLSWDYQFVHKHDPAEASEIPYDIPNTLIHHAKTDNPVRFGPWRSVDHTQHGFFIESFIDEMAFEAGKDPLALRRDLVGDKPRYVAVLDAVEKASRWGRKLKEGRGLGVALVDSFGTVVAQVVEVDTTGAQPRAVRVWAAADPGTVVNPDGFTAQIESGIIYGLTAALYGDISIENGAVVQSNFHDYPVIRMREAPEIHVTLINSGAPLGGGGEPGTPPIAPAFANAIFAATGKRRRTLPIMAEEDSVV